MGALAGMMLGVSQGMKNEHEREFAIESAKRQQLLDFFGKFMDRPDVQKEAKADALRRMGMLIQTPYNKKLPSEVANLDTLGKVPIQLNKGGVPQQQGMTLTPPAPPQGAAPVAPMPGGDGGGPLAAGGGAAPGVLQGGANNLPPAPPMSESLGMPTNIPGVAPPAPPVGLIPPSPVTLPPQMATQPTYTGPTTRSAFKTPEEMAQQQALGIGAATSAQVRAQIEGKYAALMNIPGMDPQRAAFMASGMGGVMKPSGVNVILDDGTHQAATKVFDPSDYRYHFWVGDKDVTDKVTGTATSAAAQTAWPKGDMASVQLVPNGPKWLASDPNAPPEAKAWFAAQQTGKTRTSTSSTTMDAEGNTTTRRVTAPAPPAGVSVTPKGGAAKGGATAPATSGGKLDYQASQALVKDAVKASADARKQINLADTAQDYVNAVNGGKKQPDSAKDLALIVQAVRAMNPGTVRLPVQEIQLELQRGTYGQRAQRWWQQHVETGTLPKQYRDELMSVIKDETDKVGQDAAANWQQNMRGKALPPHLQRFGGSGGGNTNHPLDDEIMQAIQAAKNKGKG